MKDSESRWNSCAGYSETPRSPVRIVGPVDEPEPQGSLRVSFTVDCRHYERVEGGLRFHSREGFILSVPVGFPFEAPSVSTAHTRFRDLVTCTGGATCVSTSLRRPSGYRRKECSASWRNSTSGFGEGPETNSMIRKVRYILQWLISSIGRLPSA